MQPEERSFEKRAELLDAALDEFSVKNYENASLNNILKNAGISKGTFYYHFREKQDLYLFLLKSSVKLKWDFINSRFNEYMQNQKAKDIFEKFKLQARIGVEFAATFPKFQKLGRMFLREKGTKIFESAKDILESSTEKILEEMIEEAIKNGDFREGFPRAFILKTVGYLFTNFDEIYNSEKDLELEKMLDNLDNFVDFMKNGFGSEV